MFDARFRGRSVFDYSVTRSHISYSVQLEWRLAAQWAGYRYEDFAELDGELQSGHVAAYRASNMIRAVLDQDQANEMKRKNRAGKR